MNILPFAPVLLLVLLVVWWRVRSDGSRRDAGQSADRLDTVAGWTPQATRVLTAAEVEVYELVRKALPAHMVLAQVPLQRFLKVPTRNSYAEWLRRVGQLSVDLVVCDRHSQVIAIIEVEAGGEPANGKAQRRRDRLMKVLKAAEIPVYVWSSAALPSVSQVRELIAPTAAAAVEDIPPLVTSATRSLPGRLITSGAFARTGSPSVGEAVELREPPPSTWFDDFDSASAPLAAEPQAHVPESRDRPAR